MVTGLALIILKADMNADRRKLGTVSNQIGYSEYQGGILCCQKYAIKILTN